MIARGIAAEGVYHVDFGTFGVIVAHAGLRVVLCHEISKSGDGLPAKLPSDRRESVIAGFLHSATGATGLWSGYLNYSFDDPSVTWSCAWRGAGDPRAGLAEHRATQMDWYRSRTRCATCVTSYRWPTAFAAR